MQSNSIIIIRDHRKAVKSRVIANKRKQVRFCCRCWLSRHNNGVESVKLVKSADSGTDISSGLNEVRNDVSRYEPNH